MVKKTRTPEQIQADKARMAKVRAARKQNANIMANEAQLQDHLKSPDMATLTRQVLELQAQLKNIQGQPAPQPNAPAQLTQRGVVGTIERYRMDGYPDPRERLAHEPKLERFAFGKNYELSWETVPARYQTIDGVWTREPQFTLELIGVRFDDDSGEPTSGRYTVCRGIFFEDPEAAVIVAGENGLEIDESNQELFLNEMRYLRMRDWLLEAFYPPRNDAKKTNKREMVIGNKLVDVWEVDSEEVAQIPFSQLKNRL